MENIRLDNQMGSIITVFDDYVELEHKGARAVLRGIPRGKKTLYYDDFTAVEFKENKLLTYGYIQFNVPGHKRNTASPISDEYSFSFGKDHQTIAKKIYEKILENKRKSKSSSGMTIINQSSAADEILKLKQLLDSGVLTQDEFDAKKKQLLGI